MFFIMMQEDEISKFVFDRQLASVMNNTKWKELVSAITSDPEFDPPVNLKLLWQKENNGKFSPVSWQEIERDGFKTIEWIEIKPLKEEYMGRLIPNKVTDYTEFIRTGLEKHSIPYELNEGIFKINGYAKTC